MLADPDVFERDFRAVYRAHYGLVWHTLLRFGVEALALEDAVQDVFVVAYRRRHDRRGRSLKAWLYGIARRVAANYRRGDLRRAHRHDELRASVSPIVRPRGVHEAIHDLDRYLSSLGPADRELFILSELEGMSGPEIAEARGRKVQTIYTRIRKLRNDFAVDVDLEQARAARPRATARSWAMLAPMLAPAKPAAAGITAVVGSGWFLGSLAVAAVMTVAAGVARTDASPVARPKPAIETHAPPPPVANLPSPTPVTPEPVAPAGQTAPDGPAPDPKSSPPPRKPLEAQGATDSLDDDTDLLRRASAALTQGRADAALQLTSEHALRFPKSPLSDLRAAVRIDAHCRRGDLERAHEQAVSFLEARPGSPVVPRIKKSCGVSQENTASSDTTEP